MQPKFSYAAAVAGIALFAVVMAVDWLMYDLPDREPAPPAVASLELEPIPISAASLAPLVPVGAWRVTSSEPRVGGVSALAIDGEGLVALTDAATVLRFPRRLSRRMRVHVADLPDGPGDPGLRRDRDSEALLRDPGGSGWWVVFENHHELWLYDEAFRRELRRAAVPSGALSANGGIEALTGAAGELLAFPEDGGSALRWRGGRWSQAPLDRRTARSDAVEVGDGRLLLLERELTARGFKNALALVEPDGAGFRTLWRKRLPVAWRDNFEALAAERTASGYRLWMMSDDNFHPRLRTVLLVVDVPAAALPKRP